MKINEVIRRENVGKFYKGSNGQVYMVDKYYKDGFYDEVVLREKDSPFPIAISSDMFNIDYFSIECAGWGKVEKNEKYYFVDIFSEIDDYIFKNDETDKRLAKSLNFFSSFEKCEEVSKCQLLYRKMLKFRDENDVYVDWKNEKRDGYYIYWSVTDKEYKVSSQQMSRRVLEVYFTTEELAERCKKEIIIPFFEEEN